MSDFTYWQSFAIVNGTSTIERRPSVLQPF